MKKALLIVCFAASLHSDVAHAQTFSVRDIFKIDLSGYIKYENYTDSRQIVSLRLGQFLFYPQAPNYDVLNNDTNSVSHFSMSVIQTRFRGEVTTCSDMWNGEPHGVFEADFFGFDRAVTAFRIRHAYGEINWKQFSLLAGHTWDPLFVTECCPETVGYNTGVPIAAFNRSPQIRGTLHWDNVDILCAAITQFETTSFGPDGPSSKYLRNSVIPNLHWQLRTKINTHRFGIGIDYKRLIPRLETDKGIKTTESISSMCALFYTKLNWDPVIFKMEMLYGQNTTDHLMLGGYAVKSVDPVTDFRKYATLKNISFWAEFIVQKTVEPAVFIGVTQNLGAHQSIIQTITDPDGTVESTIYARDPHIDYVFRISPRVRWYIDPLVIAGEFEFTRASFGTIACNGNVINGHAVNNFRLMLAAYYEF
jgi:hypothetical protein